MQMKGVWSVVTALVLTSSMNVGAVETENRPEYQKEYEAYMHDLAVIAQTGKAPENPNLAADLAKMSSEKKIRLTAATDNEPVLFSARMQSLAPMAFAQMSSEAEIVNSVEIIRVPEEFRNQYSDVYGEQKKMISTQDVADAQRGMRQFAAHDEKAERLASHINPFRFLKEIPLTPLKQEGETERRSYNPMVDAYFNQFGRPYAAGGNSAPAPEPQPQKKEEQGGSMLENLSLRKSMFVN